MAVSIIIKRSVKNQDIASQLAPFIVQMRSRAAVQPGFITGQTFSCLDCQGEYLVISTWNTLEDWNKWMHSQERKNIQNQVDELLGEKTVYRYYEPVVGGIPPRFQEEYPAGS
ncbi:MAG: antibiotic biosynthesis monooxygenase [Desulfobacter sp.]|nr:antibiotic biosynthesis monooxygenase [Desulfobacter sp.]WDP87036.1 MAG: antibiotic biosynthesis monooxygenase [Desulfobacter sp.]